MNAADDYHFETSRKELADGILNRLRRICDGSMAQPARSSGNSISMLIGGSHPMFRSWLFSFLNVCQTLDLAPETVREEVLGDLSLGAVGYWTRRCGRVARKFQIFLSNIFTH